MSRPTPDLAETRAALRREVGFGPPTHRSNQWQPMVSAAEVLTLLDALDAADARVTTEQHADNMPLTQQFVEKFRANLDALTVDSQRPMPLGTGVPACRCYRCGRLLTAKTVSVDSDPVGNLRPVCMPCVTSPGPNKPTKENQEK